MEEHATRTARGRAPSAKATFRQRAALAPSPEAVRAIEPAGRKDPRNRLNDLTGREWVHFLSSVEATAYPTSGPHSYGHNLRRTHPSPKPPQLMSRLIEFFTRRDEWVLDPFMGVGGTLLGCSLAGRTGVGLDLSPDYVTTYREVARQEKLREQIAIVADSRSLLDVPEVRDRLFDMVLTDPPYGDMMRRPQMGEKRKRTGSSEATPFTGSPHDLGNLPYGLFLDELTSIMHSATAVLKPSGYLVLFAKDLQPTESHHGMLHADIVTRLSSLPGLEYRGCKIWYDQTPRLYPFGYPYRFVANQLHQYILIFQKK